MSEKRNIWKEEIAPLINQKNYLARLMLKEHGKVDPSCGYFWRINDINDELNGYPSYVRSHGKASVLTTRHYGTPEDL